MLVEIPIEFDYKGSHYKGHFTAISGGDNVWHLTIDNYHKGQLVFTKQYGWAFYNNKDEMKEMAEYFGEYITLWSE